MTGRGPAYELSVRGHLDAHWSDWLGDLALIHHDDGTSTLTGPVADQAQLYGVLTALRDLGAQLLSLQHVSGDPAAPEGHNRAVVEHTLPASVRTERLTLRPARAQDADATWHYRRLPSVGEWITEIPTDLDAYRATFTEPARLADAVIVELDGQVIGDFMLRVEDAWAQAEVKDQARESQAELGWVLDPRFTGHGYATEAVRELLRVCFEDLGVRRVVADCFVDNEASWRLMERIGMRREAHTVGDALHRSGRWLSSYAYAILAQEWRAGLTRQG